MTGDGSAPSTLGWVRGERGPGFVFPPHFGLCGSGPTSPFLAGGRPAARQAVGLPRGRDHHFTRRFPLALRGAVRPAPPNLPYTPPYTRRLPVGLGRGTQRDPEGPGGGSQPGLPPPEGPNQPQPGPNPTLRGPQRPPPPTAAPPGPAGPRLTPRSRRGSAAAGWAPCCARCRRLP